MSSNSSINLPQWVSDNYLSLQQNLNGASAKPINALRKKAFEKLQENGFQSSKHEDWKYTNVSELVKKNFSISSSSDANALQSENPFRVVFVNGIFSKDLSTLSSSDKLEVDTIENAVAKDSKLLEQYFGTLVKQGSFSDLNTALLKDGPVSYTHLTLPTIYSV